MLLLFFAFLIEQLVIEVCISRVRTKEEQQTMFWKQGDFGFAFEGLVEMKTYCEPKEPVSLVYNYYELNYFIWWTICKFLTRIFKMYIIIIKSFTLEKIED